MKFIIILFIDVVTNQEKKSFYLFLLAFPFITSTAYQWNNLVITAWKVSKYGVFSGLYFPVFGLNTKIYFVFTLIISCLASKHLTSYSVSPIRTKYGEMLRISPCSVRMLEYTDQNNSEYGHYLRSNFCKFTLLPL